MSLLCEPRIEKSRIGVCVARKIASSPSSASAGLGIVDAQSLVPSYSMTLSGRSPDGLARIVSDSFAPADWWQRLIKPCGTSLAAIARNYTLTIIALPGTYLALVAEDLRTLAEDELRAVRLVGPRSDTRVPERLRPQLLPYDERFESLRPGTNADFAQRCARHFAESIWPTLRTADASAHAAAVRSALDHRRPPTRVRRATLTDAEIIAFIRRSAPKSASAGLRILRDKYNAACEQTRFQKLFQAAQQVAR